MLDIIDHHLCDHPFLLTSRLNQLYSFFHSTFEKDMRNHNYNLIKKVENELTNSKIWTIGWIAINTDFDLNVDFSTWSPKRSKDLLN